MSVQQQLAGSLPAGSSDMQAYTGRCTAAIQGEQKVELMCHLQVGECL